MAISMAAFDGRVTRIDDAALAQLRSTIHGDVLRPDDPGYADKPIFNAMHKRHPD